MKPRWIYIAVLLGACSKKPSPTIEPDLTTLPATPRGLPARPPLASATPAKVSLGRLLFFDRRISKGDYIACADCHRPETGWAVPTAVNVNATGKRTRRNAPSAANTRWAAALMWDGRESNIEAVVRVAWKGQLGVEPDDAVAHVATLEGYRSRFRAAFGADPSGERAVQALAAFLSVLASGDAPYDRFVAGDAQAMDASAQRGMKLFGTLGCAQCHSGAMFTDGDTHNVGIGSGKVGESADHGVAERTHLATDEGKFRTPSLRDVALTAPYFHDGSAATLAEALRIAVGGGIANPNLDPLKIPRSATAAELADLEAFLRALTGVSNMTAPSSLPDR